MHDVASAATAIALQRPRLRFMTCGSVDDGKSTLIGRMLVETGAIFQDHLAEAERASAGPELDFALLVDGLRAEREQGITIDVAYRYFATRRRAFLIADAPGHEQYTRNQAAAASQTELAILVVSAIDGVQPQTRRHMAIAALFGVRDIVLAVNKMDLAEWRPEPFHLLEAELSGIAASLGQTVVATVPICARTGDNVVARSHAMPWYDGSTLLDALESFEPARAATGSAFLPIAMTTPLPGGRRISYGEVAGARLSVGDVLRTEAGEGTLVRLWAAGAEAASAGPGEAVAVQLAPELDLGRGAVLSAGRPIATATQLRVRLVWLGGEPLQVGRSFDVEIGTSRTNGTVARLEGRLDLGAPSPAIDDEVRANDIAVVRLELAPGAPALPFDENRRLGALILIERASRRTVAAGVVLSVERRAGDVPWQALQVRAEDRARLLGQRPAVIWLTGLSGAGKSTIADLVDRRLHALGRHTIVLDGDNLRHGLSADLGFTDADRRENIRRVAHVAALMADAGLLVLVSLISPFRDDRRRAREVIGEDRFIEVFVDAPLATCQQRDPKGMYARARAGDLPRFTGVDTPYEPPETPELHLRTDRSTPVESAEAVFALLRARGVG